MSKKVKFVPDGDETDTDTEDDSNNIGADSESDTEDTEDTEDDEDAEDDELEADSDDGNDFDTSDEDEKDDDVKFGSDNEDDEDDEDDNEDKTSSAKIKIERDEIDIDKLQEMDDQEILYYPTYDITPSNITKKDVEKIDIKFEDLFSFSINNNDIEYKIDDKHNRHIQEEVSNKKEFTDYSDTTEIITLFFHQTTTGRYLKDQDEMVIISQPGTGKSCTVFNFIQFILEEMVKEKSLFLEKYPKAYIAVKNDFVKREVQKQLVCVCQKGKYETNSVMNANDRSKQLAAISLSISKYMRIETYEKLLSKIHIDINTDPVKVIKRYSDSIFWIDEAHGLLSDDINKLGGQIYKNYWTILHLALRRKIILTTASPAINSLKEFALLYNLVLPINDPEQLKNLLEKRNIPHEMYSYYYLQLNSRVGQMTKDDVPDIKMDDDVDYDKLNNPKFISKWEKKLYPYLSGRTSYVRSIVLGGYSKYVIENVPDYYNDKTKNKLDVYCHTMGEFQSKVYYEMQAINLTKEGSDNKSSESLYKTEEQISNFIFPDSTWGTGKNIETKKAKEKRNKQMDTNVEKETQKPKKDEEYTEGEENVFISGFDKYISRSKNDMFEYKKYDKDEETQEEVNDFKKILNNWDTKTKTYDVNGVTEYISARDLSVKDFEIVNLVEDNYNRGYSSYIYSNSVEASGLGCLSMMFKSRKFKQYTGDISAFDSKSVRSFCPVGDTKNKKINIEKNKRIAIITGSTSESRRNNILELFNSIENLHGEYIAAIIISKTGKEGINLIGPTEVHIRESEWVDPFQAENRAVRSISLKGHEEEMRKKGVEVVPIEIKIFRHCAIPDTKYKKEIFKEYKVKESKLEERQKLIIDYGIDLYKYYRSFIKDYVIRFIMRIAKISAFDCIFNKKRNMITDPEKDYTKECDYGKCEFKCYSERGDNSNKSHEVDTESFDVYYVKDIVENICKQIEDMMLVKNYYTFSQIENAVKKDGIKTKYIIMALEKLIYERVPLINRFGFTSYILEEKGFYYLDYIYPFNIIPSNESDRVYYSQFLSCYTSKTTSQVKDEITSAAVADDVQYIKKTELTQEELEEKIENIKDNEKKFIQFMGDIMNDYYIGGKKTKNNEYIIENYDKSILVIDEPDFIDGKRGDEDKTLKGDSITGYGKRKYKNTGNDTIYLFTYSPPAEIESGAVQRFNSIDSPIYKLIDGKLIRVEGMEKLSYRYIWAWRRIYADKRGIKERSWKLLAGDKWKTKKPRAIYGTYNKRDGKFRIIEEKEHDEPAGKKSSTGIVCATINSKGRIEDILNAYGWKYKSSYKKDELCEIIRKNMEKYDLIEHLDF